VANRCGSSTVAGVNTWYEYRTVWAAHPWVLAYAVIVVMVIALSIIGTFVGGPLAILFIPALAAIYVHHLIVMKKAD
jgi:hypothetical protein